VPCTCTRPHPRARWPWSAGKPCRSCHRTASGVCHSLFKQVNIES
jgi:hypothetical protein